MGYTKYDYQIIKLDHRPYYPRANDPHKMVVKEWDKAIMVSRMWHSERMRKAYFPGSDEVAQRVRPTIRMDERLRGASFTVAESWEDIPSGDNKSDLEFLAAEAKRQYNQATLDNTASRIKMMLGMLGDVKEVDNNGVSLWRLGSTAHDYKVFEIKGQTLILFGGDK